MAINITRAISEIGNATDRLRDAIRHLEGAAPPPPDPPSSPPPPPPPTGDEPEPPRGFKEVSSGFWENWYVDEYRNFTSEGSPAGAEGYMNHNAQGFRFIDLGKRGHVAFEVLADTSDPPGDPGGGQHLFSISSQPGGARGWLRPDFGIRPHTFRITIYNNNQAGERWNGGRFMQSSAIAFDFWRKWTPIRVEWEQAGGMLRMRTVIANVRAQEHRFPIWPDSNETGQWLSVGNMDWPGTDGRIGFRGFSWGAP